MSHVQTVAQIVDFYMDDARAAERKEVVRLANVERWTVEEREVFLGYAREAQREFFPFFAVVMFV